MNRVHFSKGSVKDWVIQAMPTQEYDSLNELPLEVVALLYPNIAKFGPNGDNVAEFITQVSTWVRKTCKPADAEALQDVTDEYPIFSIGMTARVQTNLWSTWQDSRKKENYYVDTAVLRCLQIIAFGGFADDPEEIIYPQIQAGYLALFGLNPEDYKLKRTRKEVNS